MNWACKTQQGVQLEFDVDLEKSPGVVFRFIKLNDIFQDALTMYERDVVLELHRERKYARQIGRSINRGRDAVLRVTSSGTIRGGRRRRGVRRKSRFDRNDWRSMWQALVILRQDG